MCKSRLSMQRPSTRPVANASACAQPQVVPDQNIFSETRGNEGDEAISKDDIMLAAQITMDQCDSLSQMCNVSGSMIRQVGNMVKNLGPSGLSALSNIVASVEDGTGAEQTKNKKKKSKKKSKKKAVGGPSGALFDSISQMVDADPSIFDTASACNTDATDTAKAPTQVPLSKEEERKILRQKLREAVAGKKMRRTALHTLLDREGLDIDRNSPDIKELAKSLQHGMSLESLERSINEKVF